MMRLTAYAGTSVALAGGVLFKALNQRVNLYSACVYLSQSNACVIVLVNLLVLVLGTLVFGLQRLLYGPLRPIEAEQLYDRAWFAITETCLAMTMFREEIGVWFVLLFISLLVGKAWAWIGEGRVEILDQQPPANPRLFHARLSVSLLLSLLFDIYLLDYAVSTVRHQARPTMMVMFAFEFAVLTAGSVSTALRYMISLREAAIIRKQTEQRIQEIRQERSREAQESGADAGSSAVEEEIDESEIDVPGWEDKGRWVFYLELLTDLVRLILYLTFFCVLCVFYGLPIYIIRDVAMAIRSFYKRITDFVKYKHATRDMNERYSDATAEDIRESDVCIICREAMRPWQQDGENAGDRPPDQRLRPKKLPCGHILHFACLRSWLERQQICPTCRQPVVGGQSTDRSANGDERRQQQNHAAAPAAAPPPAANDAGERAAQAQRPRDAPADAGARPQPGNGWRRFEFGPLRLDVGAWQAQAPLAPPDVPLQAPQPQAAPQGVRTPAAALPQTRPRVLHGPITAEASTMQMQIDMIEQQVLQQINSLRVTVNHLSRVRASQEELIRLHGLQNDGAAPSVQVFRSDPTRRPLGAGSEGLPPGLTLPEGWSLLPLSRNSANTVAQAAHAAPATSTAHAESRTGGGGSSTAGNAGSSGSVSSTAGTQPAVEAQNMESVRNQQAVEAQRTESTSNPVEEHVAGTASTVEPANENSSNAHSSTPSTALPQPPTPQGTTASNVEDDLPRWTTRGADRERESEESGSTDSE